MCGIAGIYGLARNLSSSAIQKMSDGLEHRGPDDSGIFSDENIALGHRRLSIVDLSPRGHQPMWSIDRRLVIVHNGEVYNFRSIRAQLQDRGYQFNSDTDTEVILAAFAEWGKECLGRFNGMFSFAIYDTEAQELFIARDRLGIKPLYYIHNEHAPFLFASEVRSLLQSGLVSPRLNSNALSGYLMYQSTQTPETLISGIRMLPPGHCIHLDADGARVSEYWNMLDYADPENEPVASNESRVKIDVRDRLLESIERRMIADVPIGAFLSGGIDSSIIVGLMSQVHDDPIRTFTVAFDDPAFKDGHYARIVADHFQTDHTEVSISTDDVLSNVPAGLAALDHPSGDGINSYVVSEAAKNSGLSVTLSGLGGDELFAGYPLFRRLERQQNMRLMWRICPRLVRRGLASVVHRLAPSILTQKIRTSLISDGSLAEVYPVDRQCFSVEQTHSLLSNSNDYTDLYVEFLRQTVNHFSARKLISNISFAEARTYMHDVLLRDTDQMSMAHALEVRVPMLDHELVEFVMSIPDGMKRFNGTPKKLLVNAFEGLIPDEVVHRPKQGFHMPFDKWMRGPLRDLCVESVEVLASLPDFSADELWNLWSTFERGHKTVSYRRIWLLVALGNWIRTHIQEIPN